jgi:hypothetical protein
MTALSMLPVPTRLRWAIRDAFVSLQAVIYLWSTYAGVAVSFKNGHKCVTDAHLARTCLLRGSVRAAGAWCVVGCVEVQLGLVQKKIAGLKRGRSIKV